MAREKRAFIKGAPGSKRAVLKQFGTGQLIYSRNNMPKSAQKQEKTDR